MRGREMGSKLAVSFDEEIIEEAIAKMAQEIVKKIGSRNILLLGVTTGASMFLADLARALFALGVDVQLDTVRCSSYNGSVSTFSVKVQFREGYHTYYKDNHVIVVDTILDTGLTLKALYERFLKINCQSLSFAVLIDKTKSEIFKPDFLGISADPEKFLVGYGTDYNGKWRGAPCLYEFEKA